MGETRPYRSKYMPGFQKSNQVSVFAKVGHSDLILRQITPRVVGCMHCNRFGMGMGY